MPKRYRFTLVPGHNSRTRAVGFLEEVFGRGDLDAKSRFDLLESKRPKQFQLLNSRFGHWLARQVYDKYFHGWPGLYRGCFVFKWEDRHIPQRMYGFLCHPMPDTAPGFELCTLVIYATKEDDTDPTILNRLNKLLSDADAKEAIAVLFPEFSEKKSWTN